MEQENKIKSTSNNTDFGKLKDYSSRGRISHVTELYESWQNNCHPNHLLFTVPDFSPVDDCVREGQKYHTIYFRIL
jgi:hypothetical protein